VASSHAKTHKLGNENSASAKLQEAQSSTIKKKNLLRLDSKSIASAQQEHTLQDKRIAREHTIRSEVACYTKTHKFENALYCKRTHYKIRGHIL